MKKREEEDLIESVERNRKHIWWLTILVAVLFGAFFGFGYAVGLTRIPVEVEKGVNEIQSKSDKKLEVTDSVQSKIERFVNAGTKWRSTASTRELFEAGTTSLSKDVKLKMTTAAVELEGKTTPNVTLTEEEIGKISGVKPAVGEPVDSLKEEEYKKIYKELFNEEASYTFDELGSTGCPAPVAINNETGTLYFLHNCGGSTEKVYSEKITSYDSDKKYYYAHQELTETYVDNSVKTTKLLWKFDKDLNFVSTTKE